MVGKGSATDIYEGSISRDLCMCRVDDRIVIFELTSWLPMFDSGTGGKCGGFGFLALIKSSGQGYTASDLPQSLINSEYVTESKRVVPSRQYTSHHW